MEYLPVVTFESDSSVTRPHTFLAIPINHESTLSNTHEHEKQELLTVKRSDASKHRLMTSVVVVTCLFHKGSACADECPMPSFAAARTFAAGRSPQSVAVGDF